MERPYRLASDLYGLRSWWVLDEDKLIVVRDSVTGKLCYCPVMGALGEFLSMQPASKQRDFAGAGEFFASAHCAYVEFAPKAELLRQDRELLAALGHPQGRGLASPIFCTMRPSFLRWFVTEEWNGPCLGSNRFQRCGRDTLAKVFLKAIQTGRALPKEARVHRQKLKDSLAPPRNKRDRDGDFNRPASNYCPLVHSCHASRLSSSAEGRLRRRAARLISRKNTGTRIST